MHSACAKVALRGSRLGLEVVENDSPHNCSWTTSGAQTSGLTLLLSHMSPCKFPKGLRMGIFWTNGANRGVPGRFGFTGGGLIELANMSKKQFGGGMGAGCCRGLGGRVSRASEGGYRGALAIYKFLRADCGESGAVKENGDAIIARWFWFAAGWCSCKRLARFVRSLLWYARPHLGVAPLLAPALGDNLSVLQWCASSKASVGLSVENRNWSSVLYRSLQHRYIVYLGWVAGCNNPADLFSRLWLGFARDMQAARSEEGSNPTLCFRLQNSHPPPRLEDHMRNQPCNCCTSKIAHGTLTSAL